LLSQLIIVIVEAIVEFLGNAQDCQRDTDQVIRGVKCGTNGMVNIGIEGKNSTAGSDNYHLE